MNTTWSWPSRNCPDASLSVWSSLPNISRKLSWYSTGVFWVKPSTCVRKSSTLFASSDRLSRGLAKHGVTFTEYFKCTISLTGILRFSKSLARSQELRRGSCLWLLSTYLRSSQAVQQLGGVSPEWCAGWVKKKLTGISDKQKSSVNHIFQVYSTSIHKYLRQFRYSYWWRARHVGVYKPLFMTGKKC